MATAYESWARSGSRLTFGEWAVSPEGEAWQPSNDKQRGPGVPWPGEAPSSSVDVPARATATEEGGIPLEPADLRRPPVPLSAAVTMLQPARSRRRRPPG